MTQLSWGPLWSWSYGSWIYNYLRNQCLSPLKLWIHGDTTLYDKVCQWLVTGRWFSLASSTNKTELHDITEIMLKMALSNIKLSTNLGKMVKQYVNVFRRNNIYLFFLLQNCTLLLHKIKEISKYLIASMVLVHAIQNVSRMGAVRLLAVWSLVHVAVGDVTVEPE